MASHHGDDRVSIVQHVDKALETALLQGPLSGGNAQVVFDTPDSDWTARRSGPCVNAFLYGIEEDAARRQSGESSVIDEQGVVVGHGSPSRFFRLGYALTAWGQSPQDEHRMLGTLLEWCVRTENLMPYADRTTGRGLSLKLRENAEGAETPVSRLWTGLGTPARPALDLIVTVPVDRPDRAVTTEPVRGLALTARPIGSRPVQGALPMPHGAARPRRNVEEIT